MQPSTQHRGPNSRPALRWPIAALALLLWLSASPAYATGEGRFYFDLDYLAIHGHGPTFHMSLRPMFRSEQRFRESGLVLLKTSAGLRFGALPWLSLQTYYAHKDLFYQDHRQAHMAVVDVILHGHLGPLRLMDRNGNEWHVTDGFYRYRNYFETLWEIGRWRPGGWNVGLWTSEEFRIDADVGRVNLNDIRVGLQFAPHQGYRLRLFYDLEAKRRGTPDWALTHFVGLVFAVRL